MVDGIDQLYNRAKSGADGGLNANDCQKLKENLRGVELPTYCQQLLAKAKRTGILSRRSTSVSRTWDVSEGHGKRTLYEEADIPGGLFDKPSDSKTTADIYLHSKDAAAQAKIRKQVTRMASQGAQTRIPVNEAQVVKEKERLLQRRLTRRKSINEHNKSRRGVVAASLTPVQQVDNFAAHFAANWFW